MKKQKKYSTRKVQISQQDKKFLGDDLKLSTTFRNPHGNLGSVNQEWSLSAIVGLSDFNRNDDGTNGEILPLAY